MFLFDLQALNNIIVLELDLFCRQSQTLCSGKNFYGHVDHLVIFARRMINISSAYFSKTQLIYELGIGKKIAELQSIMTIKQASYV